MELKLNNNNQWKGQNIVIGRYNTSAVKAMTLLKKKIIRKMKKDNKHRNSSLKEVEQQHLQFIKLVSKHKQRITSTYEKGAAGMKHINNEEGC